MVRYNFDVYFFNEYLLRILVETALDQSIEKAVKQMLDEPSAEPEVSLVDQFNAMYRDIKLKKNTTEIDSAAMLAALFPKDNVKEPFDEVIYYTIIIYYFVIKLSRSIIAEEGHV